MHATSFVTRPIENRPVSTPTKRAKPSRPSNSWITLVVVALLLVGGIITGTQRLHASGAVRPGGVNVEPSARPWRYVGANPGSWWCVQPNCVADPTATMNHELSLAHQLGAANVRLEFPWFLIEPQNGVYDWSRSDQIMSAAQAAHVTIQPVVVFTPSWAGSNTTIAPQASDFSAFITAFTIRYDHQFSVIEMWNEADHGHYWNSGEQAYVSSILNPGYSAVKSVDPSIKVEVSGTANDPTTNGWLATLYSLGAQYDIMAFHNYVGNPTAEAQSIQSAMAAHADNRPIWLGEYSVASATGDQSALITATLTGAGPIAMAQWYNLRDDAAYNCCPPVAAVTATWGLLNFDYSLKPSYTTMQSLLGGSASTPPPSSTPPSPSPSSPSPSPSASPTPGPTRSVGGLHVSGNRIVDAAGAAVPLNGVDLSGTEFVCAQGWSTDPFGGQPEDSPATMAAMRSWHIDFVRIPLNEDCWLGINGARISGAAYQSAIVKLVHDYRAAGFYVIVDLHWSAPGSQLALSQNPAPDEDHSPAFWKSVAATFGGDLGVIYDLYNEPFFYWIASGGPDEWTCLMSGCVLNQFETGGTPFTITANWQSAGMNELIADVRATGAQNVIMVAGTNWARNLSGWLAHRPADPNVAAAWHSYPSGNPSLTSECAAQWCWDSVVAPVAQQVPVVVGETGDSTAGPETYLPSFLPWATAHGLSVVAWTWNAWQYPNDILVTDMQTGAPTAGEGALFKAWLANQTSVVAPSPGPSPVPAPSISPSPSPSLIPSPTSIPSPPPTNPAGTLFSDNFGNDPVGSTPSGWTSSGTNSSWTVVANNGRSVSHSGWTGYLMAGSASWSNYSMSVSIKPSAWASEHDGLMLAVAEGSHYSLDIVGGNQLVLTRFINGTALQLATTQYTFSQYSWYTLTVQATGGTLTVLLNAAPVMQVNDSALTHGGIGLEANDPVAFGNVVVTQLAGATPPPISPSPPPVPK